MVHDSPAGPALPLLVGPFEVPVDEQRLAADLLTRITQLRKLEMTEYALIGGAKTERTTNSAPVNLLPYHLQSIVVTHAVLRFSEFPHRRLRTLS
jgi:hypothetical protein